MLFMLLLAVLMLAMFAVPVAYLLLAVTDPSARLRGTERCRACGYSRDGLPGGARCPECGQTGKEREAQLRARLGEWCGRCGYRLKGLPAGASCPECGETAQERAARLEKSMPIPWPKREGVVLCCTLAHAPWLLAVMFGNSSSDLSLSAMVIGFVIAGIAIALPLSLAVWACLVVARRGDSLLSAGSLFVLAALPLLGNLGFVLNLGGLKAHGGWFDGLANALMVWLFAPLMMGGALGLFTACGLIAAAVLQARGRGR
ncbi:MAG: hypothetical protein QM783_17880 [Phycisphaerales bacterium]